MSAYYNEIEPYAQSWLKNLIGAGLITGGDVDGRSIVDVRPDDLSGYTQCHFFAGIGVWSHALRLAGWADERAVLTGSCPCQPFSAAGAGIGFADERHLWPHFHHLIRERRPDTVFGEQVSSKDGLAWLDLVQIDLEGEGYAIGALDTCAAGVGAPHIRQRLYWVAHAMPTGWAERRPGAGYGQITRSGGAGGMADADDRNGGAEREQPGGEHGQQPQNGGALWMGDTMHSKRWPVRLNRKDGCDGANCGREEAHGQFGASSEVCGVGDSDHARLEGRQLLQCGRGSERAAGPTSLVGPQRPGPVNSFWNASDWLGCTDGRWRPVEPGTFPLAHGVANRVGKLRAYGNAINAKQAQAFIEAAMEFAP